MTHRRTKGEGTIYYDKKRKLWIAQVNIGCDTTGNRKRKTLSAKTKIEAVNKMRNFLQHGWEIQKFNQHTVSPTQTKLFIDFYKYTKYFLNTFKRPAVKSTTFAWYCGFCPYLKKAFTNTNLITLTHGDIQLFLNRFALSKPNGSFLSQSYLDGMILLLKQVFRMALKEQLITQNPFDFGIVTPRSNKKTKEVKPIPKDVCAQLLDCAKNNPIYNPIVITLLFTGMRIGELLALKWENIDETKQVIHIKASATKENIIDEDLNIISTTDIVSETKTLNSVRDITAHRIVFHALNEWKQYCQTNDIYANSHEKEYIFLTKDGRRRHYNTFKRQFRRYLDTHGFADTPITFHQFRHTYATNMMLNGANPRVVQELLGHRDVTTTLNIYTTTDMENKKLETDKYAQRMLRQA